MKIIIIFGLLATALSETMFQRGFSNDAQLANFKGLDLNGDEIIRMSELFTMRRRADTNDDGLLSFEEFTNDSPPDLPPLQNQIFFNFVDNLDSSVDGVIDSSFTCIHFSILDVDNNRKVTFQEYKNLSEQIHNHLKKELKDIAGC
ncbi:uncharacterized protein LOC112568557 isoform X2 [Pomacea canaliculata]|uniref:uncharacterized protein LOC112568557 isoform X2 n=1 Tax=Pomacea canaliculata TaxID=400727 RepID=UPI000D73F965|nr:uncharacterized protein LOC112568557 isoform X2 [Pomacea canaliculata]